MRSTLVILLGILLASSCQAQIVKRLLQGGDPNPIPQWDSNTDYKAGDVVVYNGQSYQCLNPHHSQVDWTPDATPSLWGNMVSSGSEWKVQTGYKQGDIVSYNGNQYKCLMTHNSQSDWAPDVTPTLWQLVQNRLLQSNDSIPQWNSDTDYKVGDAVIYNGQSYQCLNAHHSQVDWTPDATPSLWGNMVSSGSEWKVQTGYKQGDIVTYNGNQYTCLMTHNSQSDWAPDVTPTLWQLVQNRLLQSNESIPQWDSNTDYKAGDVVIYNGQSYQCLNPHHSQVDWTPDATPSLWGNMVSSGSEWKVQTGYKQGDIVSYNGNQYQCLMTHNSQSDWAPDVTPTLWQLVSAGSP